MKKNNVTTFIIVAGIIVLIVFTIVISVNLLPNHESGSYYAKVDTNTDIKVEDVQIKDGYLNISTSGNPAYYCVKTTRTMPKENAICWNEMQDNKASIAVFESKKYYVWLKDSKGNISDYKSIK